MGASGAVLLAAGRGRRLDQLTATTHKSLLTVAGVPALQRIMDAVCERVADVVLVAGYREADLRGFVESRYGRDRVRIVVNDRWADDTNILSTHVGVEALASPDDGYLIVETDVALDSSAWESVLDRADSDRSVWFTKGRYSPELTGGCLRTDDADQVVDLVYAPDFKSRFLGWQKLLGLLYVSPAEAPRDREIRARAVDDTIAQYYMQPWVASLADLPCRAVDLGDRFATSFNDVGAYTSASAGMTSAEEG